MADRDYLCFTANTANSTVSTRIDGTLTTIPTLEYSVNDGVNWNNFVVGSTTVTLANVGDKVYLRGNNSSFSESYPNYIRFTMSGSISASGNIMSLLDKTCQSVIIPNNYCFWRMFMSCTSLTTAPELPATTLANNCYGSMFSGCTSLKTAPELPATTLADICYFEMFYNCTSLATVPKLPAITLASNCYSSMFYGCTNIELSETKTGNYTKPYRIPTIGTGTNASSALTNMFTNTGGTFTGTPSINTTYYLWGTPPTTYIGVSNVAKKVKKAYIGINNVAKKIKKAYMGVNGVAKMFYEAESPIAPEIPTTWNRVSDTEYQSDNGIKLTTSGIDTSFYALDKAADGVVTNKSQVLLSVGTTGWIQFEFPSAVNISTVKIALREATSGNFNNAKWQGSNDNSMWADLTNVTTNNFTLNTYTYTGSNYKYYRLHVTGNNVSYSPAWVVDIQA